MSGPALPPAFLRAPIAHRGLHSKGLPENSLAAFRAAIARGYGIELDVQPSADGVAMVFHDATLDRLTQATGPIHARTAEDLSRIPLADGKGIPTLAQVLRAVAGRVPLLVEIKDRDGDMGPDVGPLEDAVIAVLDGYAGDVAIMSFNPHSIDRIRDRSPHLPRGLVTCAFAAGHWPELSDATRDRLRAIPDFDALGCAFVSHRADALEMPRVAELKAQGAAILCWTVHSPAQEAAARRIADNVTFEGYLP